ncbi:hypothetical protein R6242_09265 [Iodobacter sp. CM08]|nr:hypothetical protein [Iodobacter sp. CM08]MDW5416754.1 hypothetical protein [Iodobacter sp. CM08]
MAAAGALAVALAGFSGRYSPPLNPQAVRVAMVNSNNSARIILATGQYLVAESQF